MIQPKVYIKRYDEIFNVVNYCYDKKIITINNNGKKEKFKPNQVILMKKSGYLDINDKVIYEFDRLKFKDRDLRGNEIINSATLEIYKNNCYLLDWDRQDTCYFRNYKNGLDVTCLLFNYKKAQTEVIYNELERKKSRRVGDECS